MSGYKVWQELDVLTAADLNAFVASQVVARFSTTTARDAAITSPVVGQMCHCADIGGPMMYTGTGPSNGWQAQPLGVVAYATTSAVGTPNVGATAIRDAALGNATFTGYAGRRYRATWTGYVYVQSAAERAEILIRDGGASTPTTSSTVVASVRKQFAASGSNCMRLLVATGTFAGAGTHTLSAFGQNMDGGNLLWPGVSGTIPPRELYVEDIGV